MKTTNLNQITAREGTYRIKCWACYESSNNVKLLLDLSNENTKARVYLYLYSKGYKVDYNTQALLCTLTGMRYTEIVENILKNQKLGEQARRLERACRYTVLGKLRWSREERTEWDGKIPEGKTDYSLYQNFYAQWDLPAPTRNEWGEWFRPDLDRYQRERAFTAKRCGSVKNRDLYGHRISLYFPYFIQCKRID